MRRLDHILPEAIGQPEALRMAKAQAAMRGWAEIVGPLLSQRSWPDKFQNGTVYVAVSGPAWAQELRMHSGMILERLNASAASRASNPTFKQIRFGIRKLPERTIIEPEKPKPKERVTLTPKEIARKWFGTDETR